MPSFLSDIQTHFQANAALTTALPSGLWLGLAPSSMPFPYAVVVPIAAVPTFTTGVGYWESFSFQISVFDTDPDNVEALAGLVEAAFDYQHIGSGYISCERENYVFTVDQDTPELVYHAAISYTLRENRNIGS